jgi:hypothetical protein
MKAVAAAVIVGIGLLAGTATAAERFASMEVVAAGANVPPSIASFNIIGVPVSNADGFYIVDGVGFAPGFGEAKPLSLVVPASEVGPLDDLTVTADGAEVAFSRFQYAVESEGVNYTKIIMVGQNRDGTPVFVSVLDDPGPAGVLFVILGIQLAYCGIAELAIILKECPGGADFRFEGLSLKGVTCSWSCKPA